jgi:hypothetical protein
MYTGCLFASEFELTAALGRPRPDENRKAGDPSGSLDGLDGALSRVFQLLGEAREASKRADEACRRLRRALGGTSPQTPDPDDLPPLIPGEPIPDWLKETE